jgi:hypothetical protein
MHPTQYRKWAKSQIGYALGDTGRSFVVGYGVSPPTHPSHRGRLELIVFHIYTTVVKSGAPEGQVVPAPFVLKYFGVYDLTDIRFVRCISYDNFVKRVINSLASKILHS